MTEPPRANMVDKGMVRVWYTRTWLSQTPLWWTTDTVSCGPFIQQQWLYRCFLKCMFWSLGGSCGCNGLVPILLSVGCECGLSIFLSQMDKQPKPSRLLTVVQRSQKCFLTTGHTVHPLLDCRIEQYLWHSSPHQCCAMHIWLENQLLHGSWKSKTRICIE